MRLMDIFEINPTDFSIVVSVYFSFRWTENRLILNTNKSYISLDLEFIKNLWVYEQGANLYFCCKFGQLLLFSKLSQVAQDTLLTLLGTGGGVQHPPYQKSALRPSKWPPNDPKFRDFSYFYMTYLKSKKIFLVFHSDFGCLEGGGWRTPPPRHLTYIFNPFPNRVKEKLAMSGIGINCLLFFHNFEQLVL